MFSSVVARSLTPNTQREYLLNEPSGINGNTGLSQSKLRAYSPSFFARNGKSPVSVGAHLRADYRYGFSVPRCRYKLINLRTQFLCIMATFAGMPRRRVGRPTLVHTVFPRVLFGPSPAAIPVHEYRYVPAHTSLCYAYLFITCAATGMPGPSTLLSWGTRTHRGDTKYNGPRLSLTPT